MTNETRRDLVRELEKPFYSIYEAAEVLGVHHKTIRNHINNGTLRAGKSGQQWRISKEDILKYVKEEGDTNGARKDIGLTKADLRILQELTQKEMEKGGNENRLLKLRRISAKLEKALTV